MFFNVDHPNIDNEMRNGRHYPSDHPTINPFTRLIPPTQQCMDYNKYSVPASGCPVTVAPLHPDIDAAINAGDPLPAGHPLTDSLLRPYMPSDHRNTDTILAAGTPLPLGHPSIEAYICRDPSVANYTAPVGCPVTVTSTHPSVDASLAAGVRIPSGHVLTDPLLRAWMPSSHRNIDDLLAAGAALPAGHPSVDAYLCFTGTFSTESTACPYVPHDHPSVDESIADGKGLPMGHPKVDASLRPLLPVGHGNCDDYLKNGTPLPFGHPNIDSYLCKGSFYSAGILMGILVATAFLAVVSFRILACLCKRKAVKAVSGVKSDPSDAGVSENAAVASISIKKELVVTGQNQLKTRLPPPPKPAKPSRSKCSVAESADLEMHNIGVSRVDAVPINIESDVPSEVLVNIRNSIRDRPQSTSLPRRNLALREMEILNAQHKGNVYESDKYNDMPLPLSQGVIVLPAELGFTAPPALAEKENTFLHRVSVLINDTRIPRVDWPLKTLLIFIVYLGLNVLCLLFAPGASFGE